MATAETSLEVTTGASSVALVLDGEQTGHTHWHAESNAGGATSATTYYQREANAHESELLAWLASTEPALSVGKNSYWFVQTYSFWGAERIQFLVKLVRAARSPGSAADAAELKAAADKSVAHAISMLNTVSIVAALFLVLLYSQLFNPSINNIPSRSYNYFSEKNLITFQAFFYILLNVSFALCVYLIIRNFRTTNLLSSWLCTPATKYNFLARHSPIQSACTTLAFAAILFLAAIPFAFALLVSPNAALVAMVAYVVSVPLGYTFLLCGSNEAFAALRDQAKAALGQAEV